MQAVVKTYYGALADGDGQKACDQMTGEMKREAFAYAQAEVPQFNASSCTDLLTKVAAGIGGDEKQRLRDVKFAVITVNGDQASVRVEGASQAFELSKTGGRWYISGGLLKG